MMELTSTTPNKVMNAVDKLKSRIPKKMSPALLSKESTGTQSGDGKDLSSHDPVDVEPKTYFANERTFIQWISAALLLLTVSSIMMGSGNYNGTSSVIAFSSLVLVTYAAYVYFRRVKLLRSGDAYGYLDFIGPSILAAGVGLGVFIVFADAVKGSEFLPWGKAKSDKGKDDYDDYRRSLLVNAPDVQEMRHLQEVEGKCFLHSVEGINLLEYQPRDIVLNNVKSELIVATPQALVSHRPLSSPGQNAMDSAFLYSEIADTEIYSMTLVGDDRLFALSLGPSQTELIEFQMSSASEDTVKRFVIQDSTSTTGSMVFVPSEEDREEKGKLYIYLDGTMHSYHLPNDTDKSLSRTNSINMKVLNRGNDNNNDPITAMEQFEGLTYILRQTTMEAWDLKSATLVAEMPLPFVANENDKWVGMALQRREEEGATTSLRSRSAAASSFVDLYMPLDTFPPQLWSFRLQEHVDDGGRTIFSFPEECDGVAMN